MRFTELPLNTRLDLSSRAQRGSVGAKRVFNKLCPTSLASAPKRKLAIKCCMGFHGRQSPPPLPFLSASFTLFFLLSASFLASHSPFFSFTLSKQHIFVQLLWCSGQQHHLLSRRLWVQILLPPFLVVLKILRKSAQFNCSGENHSYRWIGRKQ